MKPKKGVGSWLVLMFSVVLVATGCGGYTAVGSDISSGDSGGTEVSSLYSSPSELGVGDFMIVEFDSASDTTMDFAGVDPEVHSGEDRLAVVGNRQVLDRDKAHGRSSL